jgi:hypothetical protein
VVEVSGEEEEVVQFLKKERETLPEEYSSEPGFRGEFEELNDKEIFTLYATLSGRKRSGIAEDLDASLPTIRRYLGNLEEANYLRNVGKAEYEPGKATIDLMPEYEPQIEFFSQFDPATPLESQEGDKVRWMLGEFLYRIIYDKLEYQASVPEGEGLELLKHVESGDMGFGKILDILDNAEVISKRFELAGLLEQDQGEPSGFSLTEAGSSYLEQQSELGEDKESNTIEEDSSQSSENSSSADKRRQSGRER